MPKEGARAVGLHGGREYRPLRETPAFWRNEIFGRLQPVALWGIPEDSVASIEELWRYRTEEMERNEKEALHLAIEACGDLMDSLNEAYERDPEKRRQQKTPETLHRQICESAICLREALAAIETVWQQGTALRRTTAAGLESLKRTLRGRTQEEALVEADQYLLGYSAQKEPPDQSGTDRRETSEGNDAK